MSPAPDSPGQSVSPGPPGLGQSGAWRWWAYAGIVVIQLITLWLGVHRVSVPAQMLLMPVLALAAWLAPEPRLRRLTLVALFFSFLGDTLPRFVSDELVLVVLLGSFLVAHVAWIIALWPVRPPRPWLLVVYVAYAVGMVTWVLPGAGALAPAVVVYATALTSTGLLASGLGWSGVLGGALFIISDSMIAVQNFTAFAFAHMDVAIMATYILAHGLLVWGVTRSPGTRTGTYTPRHGWA
ncbi:MAG: lysoplasmalogenase [Propionibacteriaceae bacterium]|nr:lysoplasmalogenase [Propionibacteriaceae bacterium]